MDTTRELIWSGLAHTTSEDNIHLTANILREFSPVRTETFGRYTVLHFDIVNHPFMVITEPGPFIGGDRRVGFGLPWPTREAAQANLNRTGSLLSQFRIPGRPSVWALYTGPVKVG